MIIVIHQTKEHDSPSTIVDVIETSSMVVYKDLQKKAENSDLQKLVNKYIKEGKAKRIEFKDILAQGSLYN